jgi:hypothetical protein
VTQDEIIEMAKEAGWKDMKDYDSEMNESFFIGKFTDLEAFAKLVALRYQKKIADLENIICQRHWDVLQEREACAKEADKRLHDYTMLTSNPPQSGAAWSIASAIRARGQA